MSTLSRPVRLSLDLLGLSHFAAPMPFATKLIDLGAMSTAWEALALGISPADRRCMTRRLALHSLVMLELRGVTPRGWPAKLTWDSVPGLYFDSTKRVVIATRGLARHPHVPVSGEGHGSYNLVLHETLHA